MHVIVSRFVAAALVTIVSLPALAITRGEVARNPNGLRQSVVRVESSRGEICSGAVIAPDLVLTAAHCVDDSASYRVIVVDRGFRQRAVRAVAAAMHPAFVRGTTPRTQPGVDLALIKLEQPLGGDFVPLDPRAAGRAARGEPVEIAGFGVEAESKKGSARVLRQTHVVSLGTLQVANRVLVVADRERLARVPGAGACRGDSGGPILAGGPGGYQLLGIVSWSSGALGSREITACGGLTAVTPVAEHVRWIVDSATVLGRFAQAAPVQPRQRAVEGQWMRRRR